MHPNLKESKLYIRAFLREHYSDERLAMLLAHAQTGKLEFHSCCCFVGIVTADHALQGHVEGAAYRRTHYATAERLNNAPRAEWAYITLRWPDTGGSDDERRRRRLIPIIKAEMRRRDRLREQDTSLCDREAALAHK